MGHSFDRIGRMVTEALRFQTEPLDNIDSTLGVSSVRYEPITSQLSHENIQLRMQLIAILADKPFLEDPWRIKPNFERQMTTSDWDTIVKYSTEITQEHNAAILAEIPNSQSVEDVVQKVSQHSSYKEVISIFYKTVPEIVSSKHVHGFLTVFSNPVSFFTARQSLFGEFGWHIKEDMMHGEGASIERIKPRPSDEKEEAELLQMEEYKDWIFYEMGEVLYGDKWEVLMDLIDLEENARMHSQNKLELAKEVPIVPFGESLSEPVLSSNDPLAMYMREIGLVAV